MLGVIFTGGQAPSSQVIREAVTDKNAFIVAADSGLIAAQEAGITPDLLIGDMDSIDAARLSAFPAENVIRHERDKDYTDTELALQEVIKKSCDEIWIIGGGGGRVDHLFGLRSLFERADFPSRWITDTADIYCIDAKKGKPVFSYNGKKDAVVSVFPLGDGQWSAKSSGLKWELDSVKWERGLFGLSNVAVNGNFSVTAIDGRFMVVINFYHEPHEPTRTEF